MLFPPEIIQYSSENHFAKHNTSFVGIYICLLALFLGFLISLPFIRITVSIKSSGIIRTAFESANIQSSTSGQVWKSALVEGRVVYKGDTLLTLRSESANEKIRLLKNKCEINQGFISDLGSLISGRSYIQTDKYRNEKNQYNAKLDKHRIDLDLLQRQYELQKLLYEKNVSPKMEFLKSRNFYEACKLKQKVIEKESLRNWQNELSRLIQENQSIKSSILQLRKDLDSKIITAPISGTLQQVAGIKMGSFIVPGQLLASISPNEKLLVECFVSPSDIGYLKINQSTIIQISSYNFHQWGSIHGEIAQISDDVIIVNNQPVFKVRCQLNQTYLSLKTGQIGKLKKGMTSTCRFVLTKRTLLQLLFDKVENWINPNLDS